MSEGAESLLSVLVSAATPGPWDAGTSQLVGGPEYPTIWPRGRSPMCRLDLRPGVPKERNEADARLAALAPTLAALLIEAIETAGRVAQSCQPPERRLRRDA